MHRRRFFLICEWSSTSSPFPQEYKPFWHTTPAMRWSALMIVSSYVEYCLSGQMITTIRTFYFTFCYFYMGCLKKCFCRRMLLSPEDFSNYGSTSFISRHRGKNWSQFSKITCPPNSQAPHSILLVTKHSETAWNQSFLLHPVLLTCFWKETHGIHPSAANHRSFQFYSFLAIFFMSF